MKFFLSYGINVSALCLFFLPIYSMEIEEYKLCINELDNKTFYAPSQMCNDLNTMGIPCFIKDPVIPVTILQNDCDTETKKISPFPPYIPARYLWQAKEGTALSFAIHGKQIQLVCANNPKTTLSFDNELAKRLAIFSKNPVFHFMGSSQPVIKPDQEQIDQGILRLNRYFDGFIDDRLYLHGPNGFTNMKQLIIDFIKHSNQKNTEKKAVLLLCWLNEKIIS